MTAADSPVGITGNVVVVVDRADGTRSTHQVPNLVMTTGDTFYAMRAALETPPTAYFTDGTTAFDGVCEIRSGVDANPAKSSNRGNVNGTVLFTKAIEATYPKRNDADTANVGRGATVVSYKYVFAPGEGTSENPISSCLITNPSPGASEPLLMWANGLNTALPNKNAGDTHTIFINHTLLGVAGG